MALPRPLVFALPVLLASLLSACVVAPPRVAVHADVVVPAPVWVPPPPPPVVSVYVEPPLVQPAPVAIEIAPPPMLVEVPPPPPYPEAVWIGGYWGWHARWVWCAGRWSAPPQPGYVWAQPYYEHRDGVVVFVPGFWLARGVAFVPPPPSLRLSVEIGVGGGPRPIGPLGVFVPPPPGSRPGLVVPAPLGTPPAVVISAPPVTNVGMRVQTNIDSHNTTVVNHITNVTNVTVVAPASATASGRAFQGSAPTQAHLAAAMPAFVHATAPVPVATAPVPVYVPGHAPAALPAPQPVHIQAASATMAAPVLAPPHPAGHVQAAPDRPHLPAAVESPHPAPHAMPAESPHAERPMERPMERSIERPIEHPPTRPDERALERPPERVHERPQAAPAPVVAAHPARPEAAEARPAPQPALPAKPAPAAHGRDEPKDRHARDKEGDRDERRSVEK